MDGQSRWRRRTGYDRLGQVTQDWTETTDGQDDVASSADNGPSKSADGEVLDGSIQFDDGSTVTFQNIEKVDW